MPSETPQASKKTKPLERLGQALVISAAAHVVSGLIGHGTGETRDNKSPTHQTQTQEVDPQQHAREQHERFQQRRRQIVLEARQQIEQGQLELGHFTIKANAIDIQEYQQKESNLQELFQEYDRVSHVFIERLRAIVGTGRVTVQAFSEALIAATEEYHYQGVGGFMSDLIHDKTGSCEQISHFVVSLLQDNGYGRIAFIRQYPPDATGYGHVAPMIETRYTNGQIEDYDVTGGSTAFAEGSRMAAHELVEAYARHFHLFDTARDADRMHFPAQTTAANGTPARLPDEEGHFEYPIPPDGHNIPFPAGTVPFFANHIISFYHIPPRTHANTRQEVLRERHLSEYEIDQAILGVRVHDVLLDNHIYVGGAHSNSNDTLVDTFPPISNEDLEQLSRDINIVEAILVVEPNPVKKAELCGLLAAAYEALRLDSNSKLRFRAAIHAERMREHYVKEGQTALEHNPITPQMFFESTQRLPPTKRHGPHATYERSEAIDGLKGLIFLGPNGQNLFINIAKEFLSHETDVPSADLRIISNIISTAALYQPIQEKVIELLQQLPPDQRMDVISELNRRDVTLEGPVPLAREARARSELLEWYRDNLDFSSGHISYRGNGSFHQILEKVDQLTELRQLTPDVHDALVRSGLDLFYMVYEEVDNAGDRQVHYPFPDREDLLNWLRAHPSPTGERQLRLYEQYLISP